MSTSTSDFQSIVAALYDGGWTSQDAEWLQEEYGLPEEYARSVCAAIGELNESDND